MKHVHSIVLKLKLNIGKFHCKISQHQHTSVGLNISTTEGFTVVLAYRQQNRSNFNRGCRSILYFLSYPSFYKQKDIMSSRSTLTQVFDTWAEDSMLNCYPRRQNYGRVFFPSHNLWLRKVAERKVPGKTFSWNITSVTAIVRKTNQQQIIYTGKGR